MGVARVFAFHEDAIATKDRRSAVTLFDLFILEINLGEDAEAADDAGDRIPVHLHQPFGLGQHRFHRFSRSSHNPPQSTYRRLSNLRMTRLISRSVGAKRLDDEASSALDNLRYGARRLFMISERRRGGTD